jgi:hypothetical protein
MQRITLLLPPDLKAQAQRQAHAKGISLGELIREVLKTEPTGPRAADPLFADTAVFLGDTPPDLSLHHDRYLYDDPHSS